MTSKEESNNHNDDSNHSEEEGSNGGEESLANNAAGSTQDDEVEESEDYEMSENGGEDNNGDTGLAGDEEEVVDEEEEEEDDTRKDNGEGARKDSSSKTRSKSTSSIKSRYLWVSGVPNGTKSQHLEELFEKYAKVLAIKIIRGSGSSLLAFVKLDNIEQAQKCYEKLNKVEFRGTKLELSKDRPESSEKPGEKIGFKDIRFRSRPRGDIHRPSYRQQGRGVPPFRHDSSRDRRGGGYSHREHHSGSGGRFNDFRARGEREELLKLEREKEKLKLERMKLERDRLELLKMKTYAERNKLHEDSKRRPMDGLFVEDKRSYSDYPRREDFSNRKFESDRKGYGTTSRSGFTSHSRGGGSRYDDNGRGQDRYESSSSHQYRSQAAPSSSWQSSTSDRWQSSSYEPSTNSAPRLMSSSISSAPRIHSSSDSIGMPSSRGYFSSRRY